MKGNPVLGTIQRRAATSVESAVKTVMRGAGLALALALVACSSPADAPLPIEVEIQVADAVVGIQGSDAQMSLNLTVTNHESGPVWVGPICASIEVRGEEGGLLFDSSPPFCVSASADPVAPGETVVLADWSVRAPIVAWGDSLEGRYRVGVPVTAPERRLSSRVVSGLFAVERE